MGYGERPALVGFKRDLLRQHDIARDEVAIRNEAPFADMVPRVAEFLDVRLGAVMDPITRPGIAADDVEISESLIASALLRREPLLQQGQRSRLGFKAERSGTGTRPRHTSESAESNSVPSKARANEHIARTICWVTAVSHQRDADKTAFPPPSDRRSG